MRQTDGEDLVGAHAGIIARGAVEHVEQAACAPAEARKARAHLRGQPLITLRRLLQLAGKARHDAQGVVPQGVDLDRFAAARCHHPLAHPGVHPGELDTRLTGAQQAVSGVHADAIARAPDMPVDDRRQHREHARQRRTVARGLEVGAPGLQVPERGIHTVVVGPGAGTGKDIRQHALVDEAGEGLENAPRALLAAGGERQPGQGDHGVAAPVAEPRVARNHGLAVRHLGQRPREHEAVGGQYQLLQPGGRPAQAGGVQARAREHPAVVGLETPQRVLETGRGICVQTGGDPRPDVRRQVQQRLAHTQVIVNWIESAFAFHRQVEVLDPGVLAAQLAARHLDSQLQAVGVGDSEPPALLLADRIEIPGPGISVMVACVDQQSQPQLYCCAVAGRGYQAVGDVAGVRPRFEPDALLEAQRAHRVAPDGHAALEMKRLDVHIPLRRHGTARPVIGAEFPGPAAVE